MTGATTYDWCEGVLLIDIVETWDEKFVELIILIQTKSNYKLLRTDIVRPGMLWNNPQMILEKPHRITVEQHPNFPVRHQFTSSDMFK